MSLALQVLAAVGGLGYGILVYIGFAFAPSAHAGVFVNGGIPFWTIVLMAVMSGFRIARPALDRPGGGAGRGRGGEAGARPGWGRPAFGRACRCGAEQQRGECGGEQRRGRSGLCAWSPVR